MSRRIDICPQMLIVEFQDANASSTCVFREERLSSTRLQGPLTKLAVLQDNLVGKGLALIEGVKDTGVPDRNASHTRMGGAFCSSQGIHHYHAGFCIPVLLSGLPFASFPRCRSVPQHIFSFRIWRRTRDPWNTRREIQIKKKLDQPS